MDYPGQSKAVRAVWSFVQKIVADSPRLRARLRRSLDQGAMPYFEDGHFYSPVVHPAQVQLCRETLWPESPNAVLDVDFCHEAQRSFISTVLQPYLHDFDYGKATGDESVDHLFSLKNDQFGGLDAVLLFSVMGHFAPRRVVEVGSGYSTLLMCDANQRFLGGRCAIDCIEPYPRDFLLDLGRKVTLHQAPVQQASMEIFDRLEAGDVLFVDSSHVAKTGSDVNHLFFEVFPRLASGVIIHVHDIFLPFEYPESWVIDERRSWNEQYLLRALLMGSDSYEILFGAAYAGFYLSRELRAAFDAAGQPYYSGGSFWMVKRC